MHLSKDVICWSDGHFIWIVHKVLHISRPFEINEIRKCNQSSNMTVFPSVKNILKRMTKKGETYFELVKLRLNRQSKVVDTCTSNAGKCSRDVILLYQELKKKSALRSFDWLKLTWRRTTDSVVLPSSSLPILFHMNYNYKPHFVNQMITKCVHLNFIIEKYS